MYTYVHIHIHIHIHIHTYIHMYDPTKFAVISLLVTPTLNPCLKVLLTSRYTFCAMTDFLPRFLDEDIRASLHVPSGARKRPRRCLFVFANFQTASIRDNYGKNDPNITGFQTGSGQTEFL